MAGEEEEDQRLDIVTTSKRFLVEKVCFSCTEWHRTEENGEPRRFILNLPLNDDDN